MSSHEARSTWLFVPSADSNQPHPGRLLPRPENPAHRRSPVVWRLPWSAVVSRTSASAPPLQNWIARTGGLVGRVIDSGRAAAATLWTTGRLFADDQGLSWAG